MADDFYPLYLVDLSQQEKSALVAIFHLAMSAKSRSRLVTVKELEEIGKKTLRLPRSANFSLRSALSKDFHSGRQLDVPHQKWVFLYNYAMGELRNDALRKRPDVLAEINKLHEMGLKSGRYARDIHLLNLEFLKLKSWDEEANEKLNGAYIGFRYSYHRPEFVISAMIIRQEAQREVFNARTFMGGEDRESRGYVYERRSRVHLFGFIGNDYHAEFYSLMVDGENADTLHGIVSTVSSDGVPHAKQCLFIRMSTLRGLENMAKTFTLTQSNLQRLRNAIDSIWEPGQPGTIRRTNARLLRLGDYLKPDYSVQPKRLAGSTG